MHHTTVITEPKSSDYDFHEFKWLSAVELLPMNLSINDDSMILDDSGTNAPIISLLAGSDDVYPPVTITRERVAVQVPQVPGNSALAITPGMSQHMVMPALPKTSTSAQHQPGATNSSTAVAGPTPSQANPMHHELSVLRQLCRVQDTQVQQVRQDLTAQAENALSLQKTAFERTASEFETCARDVASLEATAAAHRTHLAYS